MVFPGLDNKGIGFRMEWFPWSGLGTIRVLVSG